MSNSLRVLVLSGGPDRERPVSLQSGANVASALRQAGHEVLERDILPGNLTALDEFVSWPGNVIFPMLHGSWGEGGGLQRILDTRQLPYVGCNAAAAELCMDKDRTKSALADAGVPTPPWQLLFTGQKLALEPPLVVKPPREGSSIDLAICRDRKQADEAIAELCSRHPQLLIEKFITGKELTVGVLGFDPADPDAKSKATALPIIQIVPAGGVYDYEAKYNRDDTRYLLDKAEVGLSSSLYQQIQQLAVQTFEVLGCRHMARVDVMLDGEQHPWVLEVNTIPGFTSHSLLPMAAVRAGLPAPMLVDHLARLARGE